jgi:ankyrin repeat protein/SAM-dependent methyltransferase
MAEHLEWFAAQHKQQNEAAKDYPETPEGRKIFDAACKGDDKELKKLLRKYSDRVKYLLEERVNGQTALMAACAKGLTKCARLLMQTPTAVVAEDDKGRTPLHLAASHGHADCVSELYICGAEMENADERGFRATHCAAANGHTTTLERLWEALVDLNAEAEAGMTPGSVAAANGRLEVLKLLQGWGGDLQKKTSNGASNLHRAARGGHGEALAFLLTIDRDVDAADAHGCTALHDARGSCALKLIEAGADVHAKTTAQRLTPLHKAAWRDDVEALNALLDAGALSGHKDAAGRRPLHHAAAAGARSACELLLSHGADVTLTADDGSTPATAAATAGFSALAEDVLARAQYRHGVYRELAREAPGIIEACLDAADAARARWAKAFVDAGCPSAHHAAALVESNAGDRRYGEVGFWTSALILRAARAASTARIADLGSGVGRFTLAAALLMPEARVVGVEIAPELHAVAAKVGVPNLSHRCQDFLADDECWTCDVLFANSTTFSSELIADVERKCASLKRGAVVVTLTTRLDAPELELVERFDAPASWGVATCFVHRRA